MFRNEDTGWGLPVVFQIQHRGLPIGSASLSTQAVVARYRLNVR
ncbi:MAG: hypothetical protein ACREYF_00350 [Gammaproteobacteria bacterium]